MYMSFIGLNSQQLYSITPDSKSKAGYFGYWQTHIIQSYWETAFILKFEIF
jgi:hypothetical protein